MRGRCIRRLDSVRKVFKCYSQDCFTGVYLNYDVCSKKVVLMCDCLIVSVKRI